MTRGAPIDNVDGGQDGPRIAPNGLWEAGSYVGRLVRHELVTSGLKGTPGIKLTFEVYGYEIDVHVWITDASADIAAEQLQAVGWNGDFVSAGFDPPDEVPLWMKHEEYRGRMQERWSISTLERRPPPAPTDDALVRFAARYKNLSKAPPAAPPGRPVAARPAAKPAPKPRPDAGPPPQPARSQKEAWAVWQASGAANDPDAFWDAVDDVAGVGADPESLTPEQWRQVADAAPPF